MPDGDGRDYVLLRTCVLFWDALHWIAYRDFAHPGNRIGPRMLGVLPRFDEEGDDEEAGRYGLAFELLIDHASRGNIRLYARDGRSDLLEPGQKLEFPCQLSPDFVKRADYTCEDGEGPSLYDEDQGYHDLAVGHSDLICEFWNESRHWINSSRARIGSTTTCSAARRAAAQAARSASTICMAGICSRTGAPGAIRSSV